MSFTVQAQLAIRAAILADWRASYLALLSDLDVEEDSDAFNQADAFSFPLEGLEAKALALTFEIFPDTASTSFLEKHAALIGMTRKPATQARFNATATGTGSYATTDDITAADGQRYRPVSASSITVTGSILLEAQEAGTAGNKATGTLLTWSSAPSGLNPGLTVNSTSTDVVTAVDAELDAALARRVLAWWRERPGGGNRADWVNWCEEVAEVDKAFCYPLRSAPLGDDTLGCVMNLVLPAVPTTTTAAGEPAASGSRIASGSVLSEVTALLRGTGDYATTGGKIPCVLDPSDVGVVAATPLPTNVTVELVMGSGYSFPWAGTATTTSGSSGSSINIASRPAGMVADTYVAIPDATVRGGYAYRRVTNSSGLAVTLDAAVDTVPGVGVVLRPIPANAASIRTAILAVIDALGPGVNLGGGSVRHPDESWGDYYGTLYPASLVAACMGVPGLPGAPASVEGVVSAEVTAPAAAVVAAAEQLITLGTLLLSPG